MAFIFEGWDNNWYDKIQKVIPRVYHKLLRKDNFYDLYPQLEPAVVFTTLTSAEGTVVGNTLVTIDALEENQKYYYKVGTVASNQNIAVDNTWTEWNGTAEITAATGSKLVFVTATHIEDDYIIKKSGVGIVVAKPVA